MNTNKTLSPMTLILGSILALAPSFAGAQTALSQLGAAAGVDAAPLARTLRDSRALAASFPKIVIPVRRDVLGSCGFLAQQPIRPWNVKQAALVLQTCLNHVYPADAAYEVRASAARFGVRACPEAAAGAMSCQAIVEVEGVSISVIGTVPAGDPVVGDLAYSLNVRDGMLMGFHAILVDDTDDAR
ncbi:MAG: hypothetical protein KGM24_12960 [Elusimicrobia bacterium]|nr:hypothetical protein [Elusimicrobiota bacterium]